MSSYGGSSETTVYVDGLVEIVTRGGITEYRHYIELSLSAMAIYTRRSDESEDLVYVTRDHLGSSTLVLDDSGTELINLSFASFGERRRSSWQDEPTQQELATIAGTTRQGFTGHEHLDNVELIHMNGRVYDPWLGRFLSADPVTGDISSHGQRINRYSYVMNNPHRYTDR